MPTSSVASGTSATTPNAGPRRSSSVHALDQLLAGHEHQVFLLQAAEIISQGDGYGETLERLAAVAVPVLADLCLVDALTMDGRVVRMAARHSDPNLQPLVDELESKYAPDPAGAHPSIEVMHTGRARWSDSMSDDFLRRTTRDESTSLCSSVSSSPAT